MAFEVEVVAVEACKAVMNLCTDEDNQARFGTAGGCEGAVSVLKSPNFSTSPALITEACNMIANLTLSNVENRAKIGKLGASKGL